MAKAKPKETKLQHLLELSDEILSNCENDEISFEKILLKCKRLARLRDDFDAMNWFTLELHGYSETNIPEGIKREELYKYAVLSGRNTNEKDPITDKVQPKYWTSSIAEIESMIHSYEVSLNSLKPPSQFTPAVTQHGVWEKYQDVLDKLSIQRTALSSLILQNRGLLGKIKNNVYNYVMKINQQLRFENITESVFQQTKETVDKRLSGICPDAMKNFLAAYGRLESNNPAEWSQALSSCRNVLKDFADYVFPAQNDSFETSTGEKIEVTDDKYKNRLLAFIDCETRGNKGKLLKARLSDLASRIHSLNDLLSQGTHDEKDLTLLDVNICVIDTYLLIGSMLSFTKVPEPVTSS